MGNIIYYHGGIPALPVQDEGQPTPVSLKGIGHFWGRSVKLFGFGRMGGVDMDDSQFMGCFY